MKFNRLIKQDLGAISRYIECDFSISKDEANELRKALKTIYMYEKEAFKNVRGGRDHADWTMIEYGVKNDRLIMYIKQGAHG